MVPHAISYLYAVDKYANIGLIVTFWNIKMNNMYINKNSAYMFQHKGNKQFIFSKKKTFHVFCRPI